MKISKTLTIGTVMAAAMLSLTVVSYGASASVRPATTVRASAAHHWVIHANIGPTTDAFWETEECGGLTEAKALGVSLTWYAATTAVGAAAFVERLDAVALGNPNGVIVTPLQAGVEPFLQTWAKEHIPVIETGVILGSPFYQEVESPEMSPAVMTLADEIAKHTNGTGTLGLLASEPGLPQVVDRWKPLVAELHKVAPKLKILGVQYDGSVIGTASSEAAAEIVGNPDLKAIYDTSGQGVVGAGAAVRAAGKVGKIFVYGYDAEPNEMALMKEGIVRGLIAQSPYLIGDLAVQHLVALLNSRVNNPTAAIGQATPHLDYTPMFVITPANMNTPKAQQFVYHPTCSI